MCRFLQNMNKKKKMKLHCKNICLCVCNKSQTIFVYKNQNLFLSFCVIFIYFLSNQKIRIIVYFMHAFVQLPAIQTKFCVLIIIFHVILSITRSDSKKSQKFSFCHAKCKLFFSYEIIFLSFIKS